MNHALYLGYHYVRDEKAPGPNCSPNRLRTHIRTLLSEGYEVLTCGEVATRMRSGKPLPEKHATLSFDDGLKDQYTTVLEILREFGVPATFFYITCAFDMKLPPVIGFQILIAKLGAERMEKEILPDVFAGTPYLDLLDPKRYDATGRKVGETEDMRRIKWMFNHWPSQAFKRDKIDEMFTRFLGEGAQETLASEWFMNTGELAEMERHGMEIASHTVSHPPLDVAGFEEIERELSESKQHLLERLGRAPSTFGWTFGGKFNAAVQKIAHQHYKSSWNFLSALKEMPSTPYAIDDIPRLHEAVFLPDVK